MRPLAPPLSAAALLALVPTLAGAWPAALETGAPIRVTAPSLADTTVVGSFVRHDDSTLTFQPEHHHGKLRVRFADIDRIEVDRAPLEIERRSATSFAVMGGVVTGLLGGLYAAGMTESAPKGVVWGIVMFVPGFLLGGLAGGLFGGAAAVVTPETNWVEVPRSEWAGVTAERAAATPDTTRR
jgi:hypothetical protein